MGCRMTRSKVAVSLEETTLDRLDRLVKKAGFPPILEFETKQLPKRSWVKISQIRTLAVERLGNRLGRVTPEELALVLEGLDEIIGD